MVGKVKKPTKAEKRRMEVLKHHVGCLCCMLAANRIRLPEIHHVVNGLRRQGHDQTIPLCTWHHRADTDGMSRQEISGMLGPSIAHGRRGFEAFFGPEALLVRIATFFVDEFEHSNWINYSVPHELRRRAYHYWCDKK